MRLEHVPDTLWTCSWQECAEHNSCRQLHGGACINSHTGLPSNMRTFLTCCFLSVAEVDLNALPEGMQHRQFFGCILILVLRLHAQCCAVL